MINEYHFYKIICNAVKCIHILNKYHHVNCEGWNLNQMNAYKYEWYYDDNTFYTCGSPKQKPKKNTDDMVRYLPCK